MQGTVNECGQGKPKAQADRTIQDSPAKGVTDDRRDVALTNEAGDHADGCRMLKSYKKGVQNPPVNKS